MSVCSALCVRNYEVVQDQILVIFTLKSPLCSALLLGGTFSFSIDVESAFRYVHDKMFSFFAQRMRKLLASNIFPLSENHIWIREAVKVITGCFYFIRTESVFHFPFPQIILSGFARLEGRVCFKLNQDQTTSTENISKRNVSVYLFWENKGIRDGLVFNLVI